LETGFCGRSQALLYDEARSLRNDAPILRRAERRARAFLANLGGVHLRGKWFDYIGQWDVSPRADRRGLLSTSVIIEQYHRSDRRSILEGGKVLASRRPVSQSARSSWNSSHEQGAKVERRPINEVGEGLLVYHRASLSQDIDFVRVSREQTLTET
jgi:hypothetical protein